jgi:NADH:ubiquinone oxidoreductase subunit C
MGIQYGMDDLEGVCISLRQKCNIQEFHLSFGLEVFADLQERESHDIVEITCDNHPSSMYPNASKLDSWPLPKDYTDPYFCEINTRCSLNDEKFTQVSVNIPTNTDR